MWPGVYMTSRLRPSIITLSPSATRIDTTSALLCSPMMVMHWVRSRSSPRPGDVVGVQMGVDRLDQPQIELAQQLAIAVGLFQHGIEDQCLAAGRGWRADSCRCRKRCRRADERSWRVPLKTIPDLITLRPDVIPVLGLLQFRQSYHARRYDGGFSGCSGPAPMYSRFRSATESARRRPGPASRRK